MKRLNINLEDEFHTILKTVATKQGLSMTDYVLAALGIGTGNIMKNAIEAPEITKKNVKTMSRIVKNEDIKYCKAGHQLSAGRERCLTKGCKYS
jgi:hypothetical protein